MSGKLDSSGNDTPVSIEIEDAVGRIRSRDDAVMVVKRAVEAERERCAKIADRYAENNRGSFNTQSQAVFVASIEMAKYIRGGRNIR